MGGRERVFGSDLLPLFGCHVSALNRGRERGSVIVLCLFSNYCLSSFVFLTESAYMLRRFLSERGGERGGGLIDPCVNPKRDVELETATGGAGLIYEAFFGMELCVDFLRWIFTGQAISAGKLLRIVLVEGSVPAATQVGQFIKFDEFSSSHGGHISVAVPPPRSCLDCMRRSGAPCSSTEHLWVQRP